MRVDARALLRAWRLAKEAGVDLFRPGIRDRLAALPGWERLIPREGDLTHTLRVSILDALRAIELGQEAVPSSRTGARLVATLPGGGSAIAGTRDAARALVRGAQRELLVVGFTITDPEFRELLVRRACAGVAVTVVGDRVSGGARELRRTWPLMASPLVALEDVVPERDQRRRMHGKVIVADGTQALIGSANFTASGFGANFEFGVLLEGEVPKQIVAVIERLRAERWLLELA